MSGLLFIPGLEQADLSDEATVQAALASALWFPGSPTSICGIDEPGLLFALSASTALNPYPLALFSDDQDGALWRGTLASSVFSDTGGTTPATFGGTVARVNDTSGNGINLSQANSALRPKFGSRPVTGIRNILAAPTDAPSAMSKTVTAVEHTLSFTGTGSVARSGVSSGTLNGTGAADRVSVSFTPTAGSLTLTPSGTVENLQLEIGTLTAYQAVGTTAQDVSEAGVESVTYVQFDLYDDVLPSEAFPDGLTGQVFVAGDGGCYVTDLTIAPAATFSIGGTSHNWTGAAPGILRAVTGNTGRVLDVAVRDVDFTDTEKARLAIQNRARGGRGFLVPTGANLLPNSTFADTAGVLTNNATVGVASNELTVTRTGSNGLAYESFTTVAGEYYLLSLEYYGDSANVNADYSVALRNATFGGTSLVFVSSGFTENAFATRAMVCLATSATSVVTFGPPTATNDTLKIRNVSVYRLLPEEEL